MNWIWFAIRRISLAKRLVLDPQKECKTSISLSFFPLLEIRGREKRPRQIHDVAHEPLRAKDCSSLLPFKSNNLPETVKQGKPWNTSSRSLFEPTLCESLFLLKATYPSGDEWGKPAALAATMLRELKSKLIFLPPFRPLITSQPGGLFKKCRTPTHTYELQRVHKRREREPTRWQARHKLYVLWIARTHELLQNVIIARARRRVKKKTTSVLA